jgi:hypothetical protein
MRLAAFGAGAFGLGFVGIRRIVRLVHDGSELLQSPTVLGIAAIFAGAMALGVVQHLRAEEGRLLRALRTVRSGTASLGARQKGLRAGRRVWIVALISTTLGEAIAAIADGDLAYAEAALVGDSWLARGGPMRALRAVALADLERARGGESGLGHCIGALMEQGQLPHAEAERYRTHVLVKAILELGDFETARALADDLAKTQDPELAVYLVWLRAWFELEHLPAPEPPLVRLAVLAAKNHGALELVRRLEPAVAPDQMPE